MTGKAYSMREMKAIVDYLIEHKAYGEIKGRKMWVDYANSALTTRTWQSLKETFLKRIMPDLHNPYYKLTIEQVNSFRQGSDIAEKNKARLEIHTISDESNGSSHSNAEKQKDSNSDKANVEEKISGEETTCSKVTSKARPSAETVIIDNFENSEEIKHELPDADKSGNENETTPKALRDCITYSEPLTPVVQEVLDDFASEPESDEPQMEIVVSIVPEDDKVEKSEGVTNSPSVVINSESSTATDVAKNAKGLSADVVEELLLSEIKDNQAARNRQLSTKKTTDSVTTTAEVEEKDANQNICLVEIVEEPDSRVELEEGTLEILENSNANVSNANQNNVSSNENQAASENNTNFTPDSLLPNNPEGFGKRTSNESEVQTQKKSTSTVESLEEPKKMVLRKRAASRDSDAAKNVEKKKTKLENKVVALNTEKSISNGSEIEKAIENTNKDIRQSKSPILIPEMVVPVAEEAKKKSPKRSSRNPSPAIQAKQPEEPIPEKPSTSKTVVAITEATDNNEVPNNNNAQVENPCLRNVSLFDEQFNSKKYNSGSSDTEIIPEKVFEKEENNVQSNDVVMLKSHSDSDSDWSRVNKVQAASKAHRDVALANAFGFTSGAIGSNRKRRLSRTKKTVAHSSTHTNGTNTSEWSSESESEMYVSPPRGRKNRQTRKYLKPQSAKVLSLEEDGGLFVMYGKKIYPLVKDGKIVKNYLKYLPGSESEDESYWKLKYVEEKKKADKLKRLLEQRKETHTRDSHSPSIPSKRARTLQTPTLNQQEAVKNEKQILLRRGSDDKANKTEEKIKIKFTRNNEELHLEGHWPQIHPVLEQVVHIFHKEKDPVGALKQTEGPLRTASGSGNSTPVIIVDPEIHEKVNMLEKEIFKEIEERDKQEPVVEKIEDKGQPVQKTTELLQVKNAIENGGETNVTKSVVDNRRRGRPRKSSSSTTSSPVKKPRAAEEQATEKKPPTKLAEEKPKETEEKSPKRTVTPRKILNETANTTESRPMQTRKSKSNVESKPEATAAPENDDDDVRYMFPPKPARKSKLAAEKLMKSVAKKPEAITNPPKIISSPENFSIHSMDSTQGYQDSDISPMKTHRKKKLNSRSTYTIRNKSLFRRNSRRSQPYLHCDASGDSSSSSSSAPMLTAQNSSLNTEVYRSDSYQLLMPRPKQSFAFLERIEETSPLNNNFLVAPKDEGHVNTEIASSSNVSLPMSPELSVVENLSVSRDLLNSIGDQTALHKTDYRNMSEQEFCSDFPLSDDYISTPMIQDDLESPNGITMEQSKVHKNTITESLLDKIKIINIRDQTPVTGMLNDKLQDLLLESAKKIKEGQVENMEVDQVDTATEAADKTKKRCSTPRKRKSVKKKAAPKVAIVEEERIESCSFNGRNSCPPILQDVSNDLFEQINIANVSIHPTKPIRKKKDVIKVKILRPSKQNKPDTSTVTVLTDSGINDTESSVFRPADESVDLIHNHSETCLLANECVGDSLEFVNKSESIISVSSDSNEWHSPLEFVDTENIPPELFSNIADSLKNLFTENGTVAHDTDTVYHSPQGTGTSNNSLLTEDLSDEIQPPPTQPTKWFLLEEDENTNLVPKKQNSGGFGANLKQLFPITCAVPDLSTISEMSKENDDSRKPVFDTDGDTRDNLNSVGPFDSNF